MGGRKVEGSEEQKRARARDAKRRGKEPSEESGTTGAPRQRKHVGGKADKDEKLATRHEGRQPDRGG